MAAIEMDATNKMMLRVSVNDQDYTAIVMDDHRVLEVKGPRPHMSYESKEAWTTSLQVTMDHVKVSMEGDKKPKKAKAEKPKTCNVPKRTCKTDGSAFMHHIYELMMEASVPLTDEVIDAYNHVVSFLRKQTSLRTYCPRKSAVYDSSIELRTNASYMLGVATTFTAEVTYDQRVEICRQFGEIYTPLYLLIAPLIEPYRKQKYNQCVAQIRLEHTKKSLLKLHDAMEAEMARHAHQMKVYHATAKHYQQDIETYENQIKA